MAIKKAGGCGCRRLGRLVQMEVTANVRRKFGSASIEAIFFAEFGGLDLACLIVVLVVHTRVV